MSCRRDTSAHGSGSSDVKIREIITDLSRPEKSESELRGLSVSLFQGRRTNPQSRERKCLRLDGKMREITDRNQSKRVSYR